MASAALTDIDRVKLLYGITRQSSTFQLSEKPVATERTAAETKLLMYRESLATVTDPKAKKRLAKAIERKERQVEYLRLIEETNPEGRYILWTREPAVYALVPGGLVGVGFNKEAELLSLCSGFSRASRVGKSFADLGFREPVQLFHRIYAPNDMMVEGIFMADVNNPAPAASGPGASAPAVSAPAVSAPAVSAPAVSGPAPSAPEVSGPAPSAPEVSGPAPPAPEVSGPAPPAPEVSGPAPPAPSVNDINAIIQLYDLFMNDIDLPLLQDDEPMRMDIRGQLNLLGPQINELREKVASSSVSDNDVNVANGIKSSLEYMREQFNQARNRYISPPPGPPPDQPPPGPELDPTPVIATVQQYDSILNDLNNQPLLKEDEPLRDTLKSQMLDYESSINQLRLQASPTTVNDVAISTAAAIGINLNDIRNQLNDAINRYFGQLTETQQTETQQSGPAETTKTEPGIDRGFIDAMRDKVHPYGGESEYERIHNNLINYGVEQVLYGKGNEIVKYNENDVLIGGFIGQFFNIGYEIPPQIGIDEFNRIKSILTPGNYSMEAQEAAERYDVMETKITELQDWIKGIVDQYNGGQSMSGYGEPLTTSEFTPTTEPPAE